MKKLLKISSVLAILAGVILVAGGMWGIYFTYQNIVQESIVTPADAAIPGKPVQGPLTLRAQASIIREHTLHITGGKTYAQMPQQVPKLDQGGKPMLDAVGKPVMTANTARDIWVTATTLITALNLGVLTYVFSSLVVLIGCISIWTGIVFYILSQRGNFK